MDEIKKICSICESQNLTKATRGLKCINCGSELTSKLPSDEEIKTFYEEYNLKFLSGGRNQNKEIRARQRALNNLNFVLKYYKPGDVLLDVGCSNSPYPNLAMENGLKIDVCDYIRPVKLNKDIGFFKVAVDANNWNQEMNSRYNVITLFDVIEHCRYPEQAILNIKSSLKKGGYVVLTTPLCNSFGDKYAIGSTPWLFNPEHLFIFSQKGMEILFNKHSFNLIHFEKYEYTKFRKFLRSAYGIFWGMIGLILKFVSKERWIVSRQTKVNKVQDIGLYVFELM